MIRVFDHYVPIRTLLEVGTDFLLMLLAAMSASAIIAFRPGLVSLGANWLQSLMPGLLFAAANLLLLSAFGAYQRDRPGSLRFLLVRALLAFLVGAVPLFLALVVFSATRHGALQFLGYAYLNLFLALALIRRPLLGIYAGRLWVHNVLIVGCGSDAASVAEDLRDRGVGSYHLVGFYPSNQEEPRASALPAPLLDASRSLPAVVEQHGINEIVVAVREQRGGVLPLRQLLDCRIVGVRVHSMATFSERLKGEVPLSSVKASWLIYGNGFAQGWWRTIIKRGFDIAVSLVLLLATWWIMALTALAILLEDGGPVLFRQERVGHFGRSFQVLKFRSMRTDAERDGIARWAQANDTRITRVGRFIRKTRIDELPQLLNVLRGEMSMVGPRPERPSFVEELTEQIPFYAVRHSVKPGLTGWAQVRFSYGASLADARRKLQFDLYYVKNNSLLLDLQIILETVRVVLFGEGAR